MIATGNRQSKGGASSPFFLFALASLTFALWAQPVAAEGGLLTPPLLCPDPDTICVIQQYPDADPGPGARDYTGGGLSYDGHTGTDFRVADRQSLETAPPVVAPAPGRVLRLRDDVAAGSFPPGLDCGNGLVLDHGAGVTTQLCHLAPGSIVVAVGEQVSRGQPLGRIGLTGRTQFPHVHMTVRREGRVVDPFVEDLWQTEPIYRAGGLLSVGFANHIPDYDAIKAGTADSDMLPTDMPIVLWGHVFGAAQGDQLHLLITRSGEDVFNHKSELDRDQAQVFRAGGRRAPAEGWPRGIYDGVVRLIRDGVELDRVQTRVTLR